MILGKKASGLMKTASAVMLTSGLLAAAAFAQTSPSKPQLPAAAASTTKPAIRPHSSSPYRTTSLTSHAKSRYETIWGVDNLEVKAMESGQLIRFSYRVLDTAKAAQLNDKKSTPHLIDEQARVSLDVPTMENAGQLRQSAAPEAGRAYWMAFSNKGRIVKPGDRVKVVIGKFQADGLFVH